LAKALTLALSRRVRGRKKYTAALTLALSQRERGLKSGSLGGRGDKREIGPVRIRIREKPLGGGGFLTRFGDICHFGTLWQ
jgi:hypothetical protein